MFLYNYYVSTQIYEKSLFFSHFSVLYVRQEFDRNLMENIEVSVLSISMKGSERAMPNSSMGFVEIYRLCHSTVG